MPRLSIIIPHRSDQHLEDTILSVLENRPQDCEIIVVHDGSYCDPYQLADEVVYVQEEPKSTVIELLNAGLMAACSPVVCTLLDGVVVSASWSEPALKRFARPDVTAVAPQLVVGDKAVCGIAPGSLRNTGKLRAGQVDSNDTSSAAAPVLAAGFYRRKALLALGGWNDAVGPSTADVELAMLMNVLNMICECESKSVVSSSLQSMPNRKSNEASYEVAGIAAAHGLVSTGLMSVVGSIASGFLTGQIKSSIAWGSGLRSTTIAQQVKTRIERAETQIASLHAAATLKVYSETSTGQAIASQRRKAA